MDNCLDCGQAAGYEAALVTVVVGVEDDEESGFELPFDDFDGSDELLPDSFFSETLAALRLSVR